VLKAGRSSWIKLFKVLRLFLPGTDHAC
jgi:hypothetical protein